MATIDGKLSTTERIVKSKYFWEGYLQNFYLYRRHVLWSNSWHNVIAVAGYVYVAGLRVKFIFTAYKSPVLAVIIVLC